MEQQILLIFCSAYFLVYIIFLAFSIFTWSKYKINLITESSSLKVSVIISARNEEAVILNLLQSLSAQQYPEELLEIIIINDQSTDNTKNLIELYIKNNCQNIRLLNTELESTTPKKQALSLGIRVSKGDLLLFTDADCTFNPLWIKTMSAAFLNESVDLVFGPIKYDSFNYLEKLLSIEQAALLGSSLSSLKMDIPSMCNGANMAVRRSAFDKVNGFMTESIVASGDDELLFHKIYKSNKNAVLFLKTPLATVNTKPVSTFKQLFNQRKRWAGKWEKYILKRTKAFALGIFGFHVVWLVFFTMSLFYHSLLPYFIVAFFIKLVLEYVFINQVMKFLGKRINLPSFVILQGIYSFYVVFFGLISRGTNYTWKERKLS